MHNIKQFTLYAYSVFEYIHYSVFEYTRKQLQYVCSIMHNMQHMHMHKLTLYSCMHTVCS